MKKCPICKVVALLAAIGAINWGFVAVANRDLVSSLLGAGTTPTRIVYGLVGLAGLGVLASLLKCCPCNKESGSCSSK
jgi:uncharacterized membrane protein YuzA (DUF378 family)